MTSPQALSGTPFSASSTASDVLDGLDLTGVHLEDSDISVLDDTTRPVTANDIPSDANSAMLDPHDARRLWELSERLLT